MKFRCRKHSTIEDRSKHDSCQPHAIISEFSMGNAGFKKYRLTRDERN